MVGSPGAGFLRQVRRESPAHIIPARAGEVVEVGEVLRVGFGCHVTSDDLRHRKSSRQGPTRCSSDLAERERRALPGHASLSDNRNPLLCEDVDDGLRAAPWPDDAPLPCPHRHRRHRILRARCRDRPDRRRLRRRADSPGTTVRRRGNVVRQFVSGVPVRRSFESLLLLLRSQPPLVGDVLRPTRDRALPPGNRAEVRRRRQGGLRHGAGERIMGPRRARSGASGRRGARSRPTSWSVAAAGSPNRACPTSPAHPRSPAPRSIRRSGTTAMTSPGARWPSSAPGHPPFSSSPSCRGPPATSRSSSARRRGSSRTEPADEGGGTGRLHTVCMDPASGPGP